MSSVFEDRCSVIDVRKEGGGKQWCRSRVVRGAADSRY